MSDTMIFIDLKCPECGQQLIGPSGKNEAQLSDTIRCPVHGDIDRFEDALKKAGEAAARQIGDAIAKIAKDAGFTVTKE